MESAVDPNVLASSYRRHISWLQERYAEILARHGLDGVVLHSGAPKPRSIFDDQFWPLRAMPHFQHWLPLVTARSALLVVPGREPTLLWNRELGFWERPPEPETDHFWPSFRVVELDEARKVKDHIPKGLRLAIVTEDPGDAEQWGFAPDAVNPSGLLADLDDLRTRKTEYERLCLAEANRRAALGHRRVLEAFLRDDLSELQLHLLYLEATGQDDPETPYKNIVALGEHAAILHHVAYSRRPQGAQSLLIDAGARYQGYESDVTRTAVKGRGAAADAFRHLVAGLERLQQTCCAEARVGRNYQELHDRSHELLAPLLREVGIARGTDAELVERGVTRVFLPHGLGHSLGLQTHDVGCRRVEPRPENPFLRNTRDIEPGQCFTIEPGCYFIPSLLERLKAAPEGRLVDWRLVDELVRFGGVRIEDDLVVGEKEAENLTRANLPEGGVVGEA